MDRSAVEALVVGFLQRLVSNNFVLSDSIPLIERQAIAAFSGLDLSRNEKPLPASAQAALPPIKLNYSCLTAEVPQRSVVGVDFGTAYSKASFWSSPNAKPTPLELARSATGEKGLLIDSTLYLSEDSQQIYFGPRAIDVSRSEDDLARQRFDSPKQVLSIVGVEGLSQRVDRKLDPRQRFTMRDFLTLYLAYFSATISDQLNSLGHTPYCARRFAIPVWRDQQVDDTSRVLKQMLLDGQILADSFSMEVWRNGLPIDQAVAALQQLRRELPDNDQRRGSELFIRSHVLEASAAAAAIGEQLENSRPLAIVMDVGAGTTDVGIFWFVFPDEKSDRTPRVAPFRGGAFAKKIAGDRQDDLLIDYIKGKSGLTDDNPVLMRVRREVRRIKRELILTGTVLIEGIDDVAVRLDDFVQSRGIQQYKRELRLAVETLVTHLGLAAIKPSYGLYAVVTGGGSRFPIFNGFFDEPFRIGDTQIVFKEIDAQPDWLSSLDPAYSDVFGQIAVSLGAGAPNLPDEANPISELPDPNTRIAGIKTAYRGN